MTFADLVALSPILALAVTVVVTMLAIAAHRRHQLAFALTVGGLAVALLALPLADRYVPRSVTPLFVIDAFALFYMGLMFATGVAVALLSYRYLARRTAIREEYYLLLLMAVLGGAILPASNHFASFFLGLELLSVALFGLIAYPLQNAAALEAGIKYLVLAGVSSAFLLFGMALIYARIGTLEFTQLAHAWPQGARSDLVPLTGIALIVAGVGFKLSLVPFHMWTPDVFEGAPAPVAGLLASVSKGAVFALLLRFFAVADVYRYHAVVLVLALIAITSMLVGNLGALLQTSVRRVLAYSSIAHLGYLLITLLVGGALGLEGATFYLFAYFVTMVAAFGVVSVYEADSIGDYRGLFWRRPGLAAVFSAALLSLAGIPLTVGFIAKFYVLAAGISGAWWTPVLVLVAASALGLFYYVRVLVTLYARDQATTSGVFPGWSAGTALVVLAILLVALGIYPSPLMQVIRVSVAHVG